VALKDAGQTKVAVYPLSGTVRIDGKVPEYDHKRPLFVVITDPQNPKQTDYVECDKQGRFAFHTYAESDGYRPGTYVFAFVQLIKARHRTLGPDRLGNRYNDPERNAQKQGFKIEHKAPGKTDYVFDLMVQGAEPFVPGPKAILNLLAKAPTSIQRYSFLVFLGLKKRPQETLEALARTRSQTLRQKKRRVSQRWQARGQKLTNRLREIPGSAGLQRGANKSRHFRKLFAFNGRVVRQRKKRPTLPPPRKSLPENFRK